MLCVGATKSRDAPSSELLVLRETAHPSAFSCGTFRSVRLVTELLYELPTTYVLQ